MTQWKERAMAIRRNRSWTSIALLVAAAAVYPSRAHADDEDQAPTFAVQNRQFNLGHELNAAIGVLPINAFHKGITFGGGYTYHFSDLWAWEVGQFLYVRSLDTDLKKELMQNFQVQPTQIEQIEYFGGSALVLKPLYGKFAWFNKSVIHAELFVVAGGAVAKYKNPEL